LKQAKIIHIFGASGSGSTTLAKAISSKHGYHFIDTDDAIWEKTDLPFSTKKSEQDSQKYIRNEMAKHAKCVISGAFVGWGDIFKDKIDLFVYLHLPLPVRLERIQKRELNRFGKRIMPGGDLYFQHTDFLNWVSQYETASVHVRGQKQHESWLEKVAVPVIKIEQEKSIDDLMKIMEPYTK